MGLGHGIAGEMLAPVVVVALPARQVELALALVERGTALVDERYKARIVVGSDRLAARLQGDIGRQRQHFLALIGERLRLLVLLAGHIDALLEIDRPARRSIERRVARGD